MMSSPLISVVIPAYNHEKFIGAAIDSVLQQTCSDLELIVVDDGSTDRTAEVIQGYTDSRLSYYFQENQDAYNTINRGMGMANGKYIAILNSDDVYSVDRFEKILNYIGERDLACVFTDVVPISDDGVEFTDPEFGWNVWHQKNRAFYFQVEDIYLAFLKGNYLVTTSNLFMKTEAAGEVGKFCSLRYLHDYDYIFRMAGRFPGQVKYMHDQKLLYYRIHDGNTLGEAAITGREQDQELIKKYMLARIPEEVQKYAQAGAERMVELEQELNEVKQLLYPREGITGVKPAAAGLIKALKIWVKKKYTNENQ